MRIGSLRHRITLQARIESQDLYGQPLETWLDSAPVFAEVAALSGRELFQAQQVNAETTTRIRIRYRDDVTPALRIKFGAILYNIQSVINLENRNRELVLMCSSGVNDGG